MITTVLSERSRSRLDALAWTSTGYNVAMLALLYASIDGRISPGITGFYLLLFGFAATLVVILWFAVGRIRSSRGVCPRPRIAPIVACSVVAMLNLVIWYLGTMPI